MTGRSVGSATRTPEVPNPLESVGRERKPGATQLCFFELHALNGGDQTNGENGRGRVRGAAHRWRGVALGMLATFATGGLVDQDVRRAVENRCPRCERIEWGVDEGDGDHAYVYLELECEGNHRLLERVWLFRRHGWGWRPLFTRANTRCSVAADLAVR